MKVLFVVTLVTCIYALEEGRVRGFGSDSFDEITSEVEKARLNLPDPFVIDELSYVLPANQLGRIFSGNIGIKNLVLAGMKGFKFKASTFPPLIDFHLPHAKLDVDYNLDLAAFGVASLKVNGNGHFSIELFDVDLKVDINPTIFQGPKESLKDIKVGLKNAKVSLTGLLNDEELSKAITKWANENIMKIFKQQVKNIVILIKDFLNAVLPHYFKLMNNS